MKGHPFALSAGSGRWFGGRFLYSASRPSQARWKSSGARVLATVESIGLSGSPIVVATE
jgi:hypothetical protein